jgi:hypothetical protein
MKKILLHLALIIGITGLLVLCIVYPFLSGGYDGLAMTLSTMAQVFGMVGLLLIPIGALWFVYELWKHGRNQRNLPTKTRGFYFALVSVIVATLVAIVLAFVGASSIGISFGLLTIAFWIYTLSRLIPRLKLLKNAESVNFNPAPIYLIFIPIAALIFQLNLATPLTESSRNNAIAASAELISEIEEYHAANGRYPSSLLAVWNDYSPSVVSVRQFHYATNGEAYNLFFEQPRLLFDDLGVREFVVYNRLDEQFMISHDSWILFFTPEELETNQGWFAVHDASTHWKYFLFD